MKNRPSAQEIEIPTEEPGRKSAVAKELSELRRTLFAAIAKRERVPQPFFWHLLHQRLSSIRERKELERLLQTLLDP